MKKKIFSALLLGIVLILTPILLQAQQGNIWHFGNKAGLDFSTAPPTALSNGTMNTKEGCAAVSDNSGAILFYTDGQTIWDQTDAVMTNGSGLNGHTSSTQSAIIVPHPGNSNQYYVFTVADQYYYPNVNGVDYSIVDMSLGTYGAVTATKNVNLVSATIATERITSICYQNAAGNPEFWVITNVRTSNDYYAYNITSTGLNTTPVITTALSLGLSAYSTNKDNYVGYLKASSDGTMVFKANRYASASFGELLDFDVTTGIFSTARVITTNRAGYGAEFSPNSQILYVGSFSKVYQYDPAQTTSVNLTASANTVFTKPSGSTEGIGALQLGPDAKIYVCNGYESSAGSYLDVINTPDIWQSGGNTCGYVNNQIALASGTYGYLGLPNFPNCYVSTYCEVDAKFSVAMNGCSFDFTDLSTTGSSTTIVGWLWTFGDGQSSTEQNPSHSYLDNGVYEVCLKVISTNGLECCVDEQCHEIEAECDDEPCNVEPYFTWGVCPDDCVFDFNGFAINYGAGQVGGWHWDFGDGTTAVGQNPSHTFPGPGSYEVCLTVFLFTPDGSCCEVQICENVDVECEGKSPKSKSGNRSHGEIQKLDNPNSIDQGTKTGTLEIFPNPAQNAIRVNFLVKEATPVSISILDANGRVVKQPIIGEHRAAGKHHLTINTSDLESGVYLIRYQGESVNKTERISIQR